jgi:hypothetical protein
MKKTEIELFEQIVDLADDHRPQLAIKAREVLSKYKSRHSNRRGNLGAKKSGLKARVMDVLNRDGRSYTITQMMEEQRKITGQRVTYQSTYQAMNLLVKDGLVSRNDFVKPALFKTKQALKGDTYSRKLRFAQSKGFKSVADAKAKMGTYQFNDEFASLGG